MRSASWAWFSAAGGEQAAAQRVAGEPLGLEPGIGGRLFDQARHALVGQALAGDAVGLGDGAEQRALGPGEGTGGPVEVRRFAAKPEPGIERGGRTEARVGRVALRWHSTG